MVAKRWNRLPRRLGSRHLTGFRPPWVKTLRGLSWLDKQLCWEQEDKPYVQRALTTFFSPEIVTRITGCSFGSLVLILIDFYF